MRGKPVSFSTGLDRGQQAALLLRRQPLASLQARTACDQCDELAAQHDAHGDSRRLAALDLAENLDQHTFAFVEPLAARHDLPLRQKGRRISSDIDQRRAKRRHQPTHPAEMEASSLVAIAALDTKFNRNVVLEQRRTPLSRTGGDQDLAAQLGGYPPPASNWAVSKSGSPTTFE